MKMKQRFVLDYVDRCPKDKLPAYNSKCENCPHRGIRYIVDKSDRPLTYKTKCEYKKGDYRWKI